MNMMKWMTMVIFFFFLWRTNLSIKDCCIISFALHLQYVAHFFFVCDDALLNGWVYVQELCFINSWYVWTAHPTPSSHGEFSNGQCAMVILEWRNVNIRVCVQKKKKKEKKREKNWIISVVCWLSQNANILKMTFNIYVKVEVFSHDCWINLLIFVTPMCFEFCLHAQCICFLYSVFVCFFTITSALIADFPISMTSFHRAYRGNPWSKYEKLFTVYHLDAKYYEGTHFKCVLPKIKKKYSCWKKSDKNLSVFVFFFELFNVFLL